MKILLDTNILLDAHLPGRSESKWAFMLLDCIMQHEINACVCPLSLKDAYYILCEFQNEPMARQAIANLTRFIDVVSVDKAVVEDALGSNEPDFEDGIIRSCAEFYNVNFIITRNEAAYKASMVKALSSKEFLKNFCDVNEVYL